MKKIYLLVILLGVISSPVDINRKINIYEDSEIIEKYGNHLEGIDISKYTPSIKRTNLINEKTAFNNNIINYNDLEMKHVISPIMALENFEYDDKKFSKLLLTNFSYELEKKIEKNILQISKNKDLSYIYIRKNSDLKKLEKFKTELSDYGNENLKRVGILTKGTYINSENDSEVYNNIIEIELK